MWLWREACPTNLSFLKRRNSSVMPFTSIESCANWWPRASPRMANMRNAIVLGARARGSAGACCGWLRQGLRRIHLDKRRS